MRITHGGVGDQHARLVQHPLRERVRTELIELLLAAGRGRRQLARRQLRDGEPRRAGTAAYLGVAVHDRRSEVAEGTRGTITLARPPQQLRRLLDEACGVVPGGEAWVGDELVEEAQVGDDTTNAKLPQRTVHARDRLLGRWSPRGHLDEQRVVGAGDDRAGVGRAGIQPYAKAGRAAISADLAVVRYEVVLRILGGDAALERVTIQTDVGLSRHPALGRADARPGGDADLRLHQIDTGRALGDRVLDLDARIHLDEVIPAVVGILQELDRARAGVMRGTADGERGSAQLRALCVGKEHRRGALHHLLVTALRRAVALEHMHQRPVKITEDLHLHVPRVHHQLLEINLIVAECRLRFAPAHGQELCELHGIPHHARAAPTAAPAGLQHQRVADLRCHPRALGWIRGQRAARGHHRNAGGHGKLPGLHLVAERAERVGLRTDERHARRPAGACKRGVLGEETVSRVDRRGIGLACDAQDVLDVEVRFDRSLATTDEVRLVRLGPMQRKAVLV